MTDTLPTCHIPTCTHRVVWTITARTADHEAIVTLLACAWRADRARARAWQSDHCAVVETREYKAEVTV